MGGGGMTSTETRAPSLDELKERGALAREVKDGAQWLLGEIAGEVDARYGTSAIAEWAIGVGIGKSSAYRYGYVTERWRQAGFSTYAEISEAFPALSWTHFDAAAGRTHNPPSIDDALAFLRLASDEGWSCEQARREARGVKSGKPPQVLQVIGDRNEIIKNLELAIELDDRRIFKLVVTVYAPAGDAREAKGAA
jgi:hypothetical protein